MTINNLPAPIQLIVQNGFLLRFMQKALYPNLLWRPQYNRFPTPMHLGEKFTFTRKSLLPAVQAALAPPANTDQTSGLSSQTPSYEQYEATMAQYTGKQLINLLSSSIAVADLFISGIEDMGLQAGLSMDIQARRRLVQAYRGGRTYVTTAAGPVTSVAVNDGNGFDFVYVNGVRTATSVTNPHPITITESGVPATRNVTAVTFGSLNQTEDNIPATLTLSVAVTVVVGDSVISNFAPRSIRPNGRTTSYNLIATDIFVQQNLIDAVTHLRRLGVPTFEDGFYHAVVDPAMIGSIYADPAFQRATATRYADDVFEYGMIGTYYNVKLYETQLPPTGNNPGGIEVRRGIVFGRDAGYEADYDGGGRWDDVGDLNINGYMEYDPATAITTIVRNPQDDLLQVASVAWSFIGDFVSATDVNSSFGPGAAQYYKRAVLIETA